jgi:hypothetical protein
MRLFPIWAGARQNLQSMLVEFSGVSHPLGCSLFGLEQLPVTVRMLFDGLARQGSD